MKSINLKKIVTLVIFFLSINTAFTNAQNENLFRAAGFLDDKRFINHYNKFKSLVHHNNKYLLAKFLQDSYPFKVAVDDSKSKTKRISYNIRNQQDFLKVYAKLFDQRMRTIIVSQDLKDLTVNYKGIMLKNGQVWWFYNRKTDRLRVTSMANFNMISYSVPN